MRIGVLRLAMFCVALAAVSLHSSPAIPALAAAPNSSISDNKQERLREILRSLPPITSEQEASIKADQVKLLGPSVIRQLIQAMILERQDSPQQMGIALVGGKALSKMGASEWEPATNELVADGDPAIRAATAFVLAVAASENHDVLPEQTVRRLTALTKDPDASVRRIAAQALAGLTFTNSTVLPDLYKSLKDRDVAVRLECIASLQSNLSKSGQENISPTVKALTSALVNDECAEVRAAAAQALGNADSYRELAIPQLTQELSDPSGEVHRACLDTLSRFGPQAQSAIPEIEKDLDELTINQVDGYSLIFSKFGEASVVCLPKLIAAIRANDKGSYAELRNGFIEYCRVLKANASPAVPILVDLLENERYTNKHGAIGALAIIGPPAAAAEPALERLAETDPKLRADCNYALEQIRTGSKSAKEVDDFFFPKWVH